MLKAMKINGFKAWRPVLAGLMTVWAAAPGLASAPKPAAPTPDPVQPMLKRVEYYQRWTQGQFPKATGLLPSGTARLAELPPQYQSAFSLALIPNATTRTLAAEYHAQMVMEPNTHKSAQKTLGQDAFAKLLQLTAKKVDCESTVEPGWAGPAPKMLSLSFRNRRGEERLYVGGAQGPAGPGEAAYKQNKRHYLCNDELLRFLDGVISQMAPK